MQRRITFNGGPIDSRGWSVLAQIEAFAHKRLPDGDYWYDPISGLAGQWDGPAAVLAIPDPPVEGRPSAQASDEGNGGLFGVFVNGRELRPYDVRALMAMYGEAAPGRWWVNGRGDAYVSAMDSGAGCS